MNEKKSNKFTTKDIAKTAMMAAIVFAATYFIKVPILHGYTHLGDCMIFIGVLILGRRNGAIAGGIGAAFSDLLGGYMDWVLLTFVIKWAMGTVMGYITEKPLLHFKHGWIIGAIAGGALQVFLYTISKIPLYGMEYAIIRIPGVTMQTIAGIIITAVFVSLLEASKIMSALKNM